MSSYFGRLGLLLLGLAALTDQMPTVSFAAPTKPNIVLILADDMGFSDAGCYGGEIPTPNLDRLAANGLRFTQFYNTARCWPTRAAVLTGYYAQQVHRDGLPGVRGGSGGRRQPWVRLLPELLHPLGYRAYHSGKWHLDGPVLAGGFDRSYSLNDHNRNFSPRQHTLDDQPLAPAAPGSGYYSSSAIAQHAIDFLGQHQREHAGQPFFLYLAFTSPHFPLQAPPEDIALFRDRYRAGWDVLREERGRRLKAIGLLDCALPPLEAGYFPGWNLSPAALGERVGPGEVARAVPWSSLTETQQAFQPVKMAIHAAMIHRMDLEIGRVLQQLRALRVLENTVVFFLSDNGASAELMIRGDGHDPAAPPGAAATFLCLGPGWSSAANAPFRLHKYWVHEGGIATPFIVCWPRGIQARGEFRANPGHVIDLAPTILDLAGGRWPERAAGVPPPPGKSLVPAFAKDGAVTRPYFWWYHEGNRALRADHWKITAAQGEEWQLFDLANDRSELHNLASKQPARLKQLEKLWNDQADQIRAQTAGDPQPKSKQSQN